MTVKKHICSSPWHEFFRSYLEPSSITEAYTDNTRRKNCSANASFQGAAPPRNGRFPIPADSAALWLCLESRPWPFATNSTVFKTTSDRCGSLMTLSLPEQIPARISSSASCGLQSDARRKAEPRPIHAAANLDMAAFSGHPDRVSRTQTYGMRIHKALLMHQSLLMDAAQASQRHRVARHLA